MLGYFPGLIHSWYIIAKYPPYYYQQQQQQRKDTIYYVYRSDLENQTPRRDGRDGEMNVIMTTTTTIIIIITPGRIKVD